MMCLYDWVYDSPWGFLSESVCGWMCVSCLFLIEEEAGLHWGHLDLDQPLEKMNIQEIEDVLELFNMEINALSQ
jgi:hypothetical protein